MYKKLLIGIITIITCLIGNYLYISDFSQEWLFKDVNRMPNNQVGLLLGTSVKTINGQPNQYFTNRINAAFDLYMANKIDSIIVSGDNSNLNYNEPAFMRSALIEKGVPDSKIILDYAGFSTIDSIIRARKVFGQKKFTIISQKFHNQRAIFIAQKNGIDAIAYNAKAISFKKSPRVYMREILARAKATIDVIVLKKQPKFLGDPIQIK
jgi:SanA protein